MKFVLRVLGPLFVVVGLLWLAQGTGLLTWPRNAVLIDVVAGVAALGIGLVWFASR
jgi:hypothetical protein